MDINKDTLFYGEGRLYGVPFTGNSREVTRQAGSFMTGFGGTETITQWEVRVPDGFYPDGDPRPGYTDWVSEHEVVLEPWNG
jgi:hypothetical protein